MSLSKFRNTSGYELLIEIFFCETIFRKLDSNFVFQKVVQQKSTGKAQNKGSELSPNVPPIRDVHTALAR